MSRGRGRQHQKRIVTIGLTAVMIAASLVDGASSVCNATVGDPVDVELAAFMNDGASSTCVITKTNPAAVALVASMTDGASTSAVVTKTNPAAVAIIAAMTDQASSTAVITKVNPSAVALIAAMTDQASSTAVATINNGIDSFVKLMLHGNGTNGSTTFTDSSGNGHVWTANGANVVLDTSFKKFGTASIKFGGTAGTYIKGDATASADFTFGTGDFTIDFQLAVSNTAVAAVVYEARSTDIQQAVMFAYDAGVMEFYVNGAIRISGSPSPGFVANQFYHIEFSRSGTSTKMFIDGVQIGSTYTDTNNYVANANNFPRLGNNYTATNVWQGWLDEFRISKGVARHTANFTPPPAEYS
jgi:hypothetical protein